MSISVYAYRSIVGAVLIVSIALVATSIGKNDKTKKKEAEADDDSAKTAEAVEPVESVDRYAVPDGDAEELLAFIEGLQDYRPTSREDYIHHMKNLRDALRSAAEKIVELKPGADTEAFKAASYVLLQQRISGIKDVSGKERKKIIQVVRDRVSNVTDSDPLPDDDIRLLMMLTQGLERSGKTKLAAKTYVEFGDLLAKSSDERQAGLGRMMQGSARRVQLVGNEMKLEGTMMDGKPFDWAAYRGKVVLIDFWATWCGPCRAEMPNVRSNYEKYHDQGFDVVGISLDDDRDSLEKFLDTEKLPWVTLNEPDGNRDPNADYYGIMGIPTVILVDQEGKVVSLDARGPELGRLLGEMIGPPSEESAE